MAKLHSEDQQFISFVELIPGEFREVDGAEKWQLFSLKLKNGLRTVRFGNTPCEFAGTDWFDMELGDVPSEVLAHIKAVEEFLDEENRRFQGKEELMMERCKQLEEDEKLEKRTHPTAVDGERIPLADGSFLERHPQDTGSKGYVFCRTPKDEVALLVALLKRLAERKLNHIRFETLEPSIELEITRQSSEEDGSLIEGTVGQIGIANPNVEDDGLKVQLFVDAGNVETEISRWDALGIRFFTNQSSLEQFIEALQKEFGC